MTAKLSPGDRVRVVRGQNAWKAGVVLDPMRPGQDTPCIWCRLEPDMHIYLVHEDALELVEETA